MAAMEITRRRFLTGAAAGGALLVARPTGVLAQALGPSQAPGATRASRLSPGRWLVHADLHNHTLFSDGDGDPADAFATMRSNGIDVAAMTDHAVLGGLLGTGLSACGGACTSVRGIDDVSWEQAGRLADAADAPGTFTAIRGFEWSSPTLGHMNVWFGEDWIDPERTGGLVGLEGLVGYLDEIPEVGPALGEPLANLVGSLPVDQLAMRPFFSWLQQQPGSPLVGGGADALAGFNHPGREAGRFARFNFDARLVDRIVSLELFNRSEDYLFEGTDKTRPSPLVECLDAGWKPGLLGVTDEHGTDWGGDAEKGRAGIWVTELSRAGVREALLARRFFATRELGLRVDATAGGHPMGGTVPHRSGPLEIVLDIAGGPEWAGRALTVQVLRTGGHLPTVADEVEVVVPPDDGPLVRFSTPVDVADGTWLVLRVVDPDGAPDERADGALAGGRAIAYVSPFYLDPDGATGGGTATTAPPANVPDLGVVAHGAEPAPVPSLRPSGRAATLPATGGLSGPAATAAGLALGASLAGAAVHRRVVAGHGHEHPHRHDHDHDHG